MSGKCLGGCEQCPNNSFVSSADCSDMEQSIMAVDKEKERSKFGVNSPRCSSNEDESCLVELCSKNQSLGSTRRPRDVASEISGGVLHTDDENKCGYALSTTESDDLNKDLRLCRSVHLLWSRLRRMGCVVDAVQARTSRRKAKCSVENCIYQSGPVENIGLRFTLPSNVESAAQWICICLADIKHQNDLLIKLFNVLMDGQPTMSHFSATQYIPREKLLLFPFRICSLHFSTESEDLSLPIMPTCHLPEKRPLSREDLISQLRRRYIFLSEIGYEDIKIDKLEPNGILLSPLDAPISCNIPGCRYKSSDISIFSGRYMKFFSVPSNSVDYGKWCVATRDGLGLPTTFDFCLPEDGHICEMHFIEGKRHVRGIMQDPTIFRKLALEGINASLSSLGALRCTTCAVNSCANKKMETLCVPFPKASNPLNYQWVTSLSEADQSFKYEDGMAVCIRHFSLSHLDGLVPHLFLGNETALETCSQHLLKRREQRNAPHVVKKIRFEKSGSGSGFSKSITTVEPCSIHDEAEEGTCCFETRSMLSIVERMEKQSCTVERLVEYLNTVCKDGLLPTDGSLDKFVKFQLFDILSELRSQKGIVHTLRQRLDDALHGVVERSVS